MEREIWPSPKIVQNPLLTIFLIFFTKDGKLSHVYVDQLQHTFKLSAFSKHESCQWMRRL